MVEYTIKDVTENDVKELQAISRETFKATFDECTAPADMARFLKKIMLRKNCSLRLIILIVAFSF